MAKDGQIYVEENDTSSAGYTANTRIRCTYSSGIDITLSITVYNKLCVSCSHNKKTVSLLEYLLLQKIITMVIIKSGLSARYEEK